MSFPIIDVHSHPTLKPFGQSFYPNENPKDATSEACIWHGDPPTATDKAMENVLGFPPYREADFTSLQQGGVKVAIVSLYPIEKGFVNPTLLPQFAKYTVDWITMFGRKRVENIKSPSFNYFQDLNEEYDFLKLLDKSIPRNSNSNYRIASSGADLSQAIATESLNIVVSIEGAHAFCDGNNVDDEQKWVNLEANIDQVKGWPHPPFFVTLNHHFNNSLASHAESLFVNLLGRSLFDQKEAMETPFFDGHYLSDRGKRTIDALYKSSGSLKRILIDIKHMAKGTRDEFYQYRKDKGYSSIPILCSHSGVHELYDHPINLFSSDIEEIYNSQGLIGVELDQRVLGYNSNVKGRFWSWLKTAFMSKAQKDRWWARYFWLSVKSIAETCYGINPNENPWKIICLGSDLDGIINPINDFRTAADFQNLANALLGYVQEYWDSGTSLIPNGHKDLDAHDVVYQIMYDNALSFIQKNY